jgi:hypothetical protein
MINLIRIYILLSLLFYLIKEDFYKKYTHVYDLGVTFLFDLNGRIACDAFIVSLSEYYLSCSQFFSLWFYNSE